MEGPQCRTQYLVRLMPFILNMYYENTEVITQFQKICYLKAAQVGSHVLNR